MKQTLYEALTEYSGQDYVPMHMPGHKRTQMQFANPYSFDITEIDGFDNLHHAEDILKEAQSFAAKVCGADETHFLINGSTGGILSAIFSATTQGGSILMARNCHKAVYHGAELRELKTFYLYPRILPEGIPGDVTPEMVEEALEKYPEVQAVLLTSPTYDGVVSDIRSIVKVAHAHGVPVIVDEAHGAHFLPGTGFPVSAVRLGADVVIQSTHKTLPALTQTAVVHVNRDYTRITKLRKYLAMFQTSSPSYVLMASIDSAYHWIFENGKEAYAQYEKRLCGLRRALRTSLRNLELIEPARQKSGEFTEINAPIFDYDSSKILISTKNSAISGETLHQLLRKNYHIQVEMTSAEYVLCMTSVADLQEFYDRLLSALLETDSAAAGTGIEDSGFHHRSESDGAQTAPRSMMTIAEAVASKHKKISLPESMGEISADYIYIYPPGIPLLTPGEMVSERCVLEILHDLEEGLEVHGLTKEKEIEIVWEESFT